MKLFKLTEQDGTTFNKSMFWEVGKTNSVLKCENPKLCTKDVIHAYTNKNLALLLNPNHVNINNPLLFEAEGNIVIRDYSKCGVFSLKIIKKINYPNWYIEKQKEVQILFAILCAESVLKYFENKYPNDNRPRKAIEAAKNYLKDPSAANKKVAYAAAYAAAAADAAAYAAAAAAADAYAAAAYAAADAAADAAAYAAAAAADAADDADAAADAADVDAAALAAALALAAADDAADAYAAAADSNIIFEKLANKAVYLIMNNKVNNI
jgi:hypothetical protein